MTKIPSVFSSLAYALYDARDHVVEKAIVSRLESSLKSG